jgi:hypothetical protein
VGRVEDTTQAEGASVSIEELRQRERDLCVAYKEKSKKGGYLGIALVSAPKLVANELHIVSMVPE